MVAKTIENLLEKISEVVDQSKTSYMHQRNQNKKLFDMNWGKLSLTMVAMVTRENLFSLDTASKNCQKIISSAYIQENLILHQLTKFSEVLWSNLEKLFLKVREPVFPKPAAKKIVSKFLYVSTKNGYQFLIVNINLDFFSERK